MFKAMLLGLFFASLLVFAFYMGYYVAIDIFEWGCFRTGDVEPKTWLEKLLRI